MPSVAMTTPVVTADWIYVGCGNGYTYRIDRVTGDWISRWESQTRVEAVCHAGGVTFAGYFNGAVAAPWQWRLRTSRQVRAPARPY